MTFKPIFKNAYAISPSLNKENVSPENVENVLNPPQKPVRNNKRYTGDKLPFKLKLIKNPRIIQLNILANKVARGKFKLVFTNKRDIPYRAILPIPPPINT